MKKIIHRAESRGDANHGWLHSRHTFSFAGYHNPERMHFGVMRVLNDDFVSAGMGFGTHPHDNMEIISIPLEGTLEHRDSMGNHGLIKAGDIQVMSAGTGIQHSEFNHSKTEPVKFLQIWLFPNKRNVQPRYDQLTLAEASMRNRLAQVLSPNKDDEGVWIHQQAWFYMAALDKGTEVNHTVQNPGNGLYLFLLEGSLSVEEDQLNARDAIGISETDQLSIKALSDNTRVLLMDLPMQLD